MIADSESVTFEAFRDSLSTLVIERLAPSGRGTRTRGPRAIKGRKNEIKPVTREREQGGGNDEDGADGAGLSEFVEYLAEEIFTSLPPDLCTLSYAAVQDDSGLAEKYSVPLNSKLVHRLVEGLPASIADDLTTYNLIPDSDSLSLDRFFEQVLANYITTSTAAPPEHTPTKVAESCEICGREHLPLTYHHLIPRQMHVKAVKRGWVREWEVNKVAWLCRACHSYVHKIATNEELARELRSVEALMEREDVRKWAAWVGKVRWKAR